MVTILFFLLIAVGFNSSSSIQPEENTIGVAWDAGYNWTRQEIYKFQF